MPFLKAGFVEQRLVTKLSFQNTNTRPSPRTQGSFVLFPDFARQIDCDGATISAQKIEGLWTV